MLLPGQMIALEVLAECMVRGWPALLIGASGSGKASVVRCAAALAGIYPLSPLPTHLLLGIICAGRQGHRSCISSALKMCSRTYAVLRHEKGGRSAGRKLVEVSLSGGSDTSDLLGGFEQLEAQRSVQVSPPGASFRLIPHRVPHN